MAKIIDPNVASLAEKLRNIIGAIEDEDWEPVRSFWSHGPNEGFPPPAITYPEEYSGQERLNVFCTQTDLPAREQKQLVARWCDFLQTLTSVRFLWFYSKVPQDLFDASCRVPNLEGLYVKWSGIETLDSLAIPRDLRYLYIGSSARVQSIQPLSQLTWLKWLQIDNVKAVTNLEPLRPLTNLEGLGFTGAESKNYTIDSFEPLSALTQLRWLHLGAVHTKDNSLHSLEALNNLQWLGMGNFFSTEEFARLSVRMPNTKCNWFSPYARYHSSVFPCRKCNKNWKVFPAGKGHRLLCPTCDSVKLAQLVISFNASAEAAKADIDGR